MIESSLVDSYTSPITGTYAVHGKTVRQGSVPPTTVWACKIGKFAVLPLGVFMQTDLESSGDSAPISKHQTRAQMLDESSWRTSDALESSNSAETILIGHWRDRAKHERRYCAPVLDSHFTIEVLLCSAVVDCSRNGCRVTNGMVGYGGTQVTSPGEKIELSFRQPVEAIHLFVPLTVVATAYEELEQSKFPPHYRMTDPAYAPDMVMGKLAGVLHRGNELGGEFGSLFLRSLAMAALARAMRFESGAANRPWRGGLAPWRLARAIDYIEANLGGNLSLNEIAKHAGLSPMYFADQFKKATGQSPHAFLMARRTERAKLLLTDDRMPLVQVAVTAGFSSQAHFTTIFRKAVGMTPGRYRQRLVGQEVDRTLKPLKMAKPKV